MLKCSLGKVHWDTIKEGPYPLFREYVAFENTGRFLGFRSTIIIVAFAYGNVHNGGGNPQCQERLSALLCSVLSLLVATGDPRLSGSGHGTAATSPFVMALERMGNKVRCS